MQNKSTRFTSVVTSAILALFSTCASSAVVQTYKVIHNFGSPVQGPNRLFLLRLVGKQPVLTRMISEQCKHVPSVPDL